MVDNVPSWRIFFGIVVPMSKPGLIATFMITLAFVWNEFLFALFLTNSQMADPSHPGCRAEQPARRRMVGDIGGRPDRHHADDHHGGHPQQADAVRPAAGSDQVTVHDNMIIVNPGRRQMKKIATWLDEPADLLALAGAHRRSPAARLHQRHADHRPPRPAPISPRRCNAAAKGWKEKTCGKVNVVEFPWSELYPKIVTSLTCGEDTFDAVDLRAGLGAGLHALSCRKCRQPCSQGADWEDIAPVYREPLMVWDGKVLSQTMDGDVHTYTYRIDLFEDPEKQKAFKAKYGYDLAPPKTWKQYLDIAEFFQRPDKGLWGTAEAFRRGGQQFWFFFSHAAAYTNHPDNPGSMFFDPDTMDAQVNNPGWVRGLEEYIRASKLAPPNALNFSFGEVNAAFAGGQVGRVDRLGRYWRHRRRSEAVQDPRQCRLGHRCPARRDLELQDQEVGQVRPTSSTRRSWRSAAGRRRSRVFQEPGSRLGLHPDLTSPEVSGQAAITGGTGVNPYRFRTRPILDLWSKIFQPSARPRNISARSRTAVTAKNVALDMRLPGYFSYTEVLEIELSKALAGEVDAAAGARHVSPSSGTS